MKFYDREKELKTLRFSGNSRAVIKPTFRIAVLGRRRIGKTRLIQEAYGDKCITFFIPGEKSEKEIIASWARENPGLHFPQVESLQEFFGLIFFHYKDKIIFIDEIQNVLKVNKSFLFDLQKLIDDHKPSLVLTGSVISVTKKIVETHKSPLYGRFDAVIKLRELDFQTIHEICSDLKLDFEAAMELYSMFGGIPKYYELVEKLGKFNFRELALNSFVLYPRPLYEEVRTMLREEFGREYKTFFSIMSAISQGKNKQSEIAGFLGKKETSITKYLALLKNDFELIQRRVPLSGGKKGAYFIQNNLVEYWFNNIWRYTELLETGREEQCAEIVEKNLPKHVGKMFEKTIRELIASKSLFRELEFTEVGSQWGKILGAPKESNQYEIDVCARNKKNEVLFAECKWQDNVDAAALLDELKQKSQYAQMHAAKTHYALFAKTFKKRAEGENTSCIDLKQLQKTLSTNT